MCDASDRQELIRIIMALMKRHTSGVARFTEHELLESESDLIRIDRDKHGSLWVTMGGPVIVDSELEP